MNVQQSGGVLRRILQIMAIIALSILIIYLILKVLELIFNPGGLIAQVMSTLNGFSNVEIERYKFGIAISMNLVFEIVAIVTATSDDVANKMINFITFTISKVTPDKDTRAKKEIKKLSFPATLLIALAIGVVCILSIVKMSS